MPNRSMKITIETIQHDKQRYETCGDWWFEKDSLQIRVSDLGDDFMNWLVAAHEIDEALLCANQGIKEEDVTKFDIAFEKLREEKPELIGDQEPGDMDAAPYRVAHQIATTIERYRANLLGIPWDIYDKRVTDLGKNIVEVKSNIIIPK